MPRICTACTHTDRDRIDQTIVAGETPNTEIASVFGVSESAIRRHKRDHLPATLAGAREAQETARADDLLAQLRELQTITLRLLGKAEAAGKLGSAVMAVGQARQNIELMAEMLNQLDRRPTVNLWLSSEWISVRALLITTLQAYPEARAAVTAQLLAMEAST